MWAMPSPRRTQGIETHNAIADDAGIGDMPPRKRTTPQTQPACAGNQRLVPDADFLLPFTQHTIARDEWIAPYTNWDPENYIGAAPLTFSKTDHVGMNHLVMSTIATGRFEIIKSYADYEQLVSKK